MLHADSISGGSLTVTGVLAVGYAHALLVMCSRYVTLKFCWNCYYKNYWCSLTEYLPSVWQTVHFVQCDSMHCVLLYDCNMCIRNPTVIFVYIGIKENKAKHLIPEQHTENPLHGQCDILLCDVIRVFSLLYDICRKED